MQGRERQHKTSDQLKKTLLTALALGLGALDIYLLYKVYSIFTDQINQQKIDFSDEDFKNIPFLYDWFPLDFPTNEKFNSFFPIFFHIINHLFPMKSTALTQIGIGILEPFMIAPLRSLAHRLEQKLYKTDFVQLKQVKLSEQTSTGINKETKSISVPKRIYKEINTKPDFLFNAKYIAPIEEEIIFRGSIPYIVLCLLYQCGFSLNNSLLGSTLITNSIFSLLHDKGWRFATFVSGMAYSGLTILHKGSLWGAIAGHMTNNIIAINNISKSMNGTSLDTINPTQVVSNTTVNLENTTMSKNSRSFFALHSSPKKSKRKSQNQLKSVPLQGVDVTDEEMAHSVFAYK